MAYSHWIVSTHTYRSSQSFNVTCASLVNINPRGAQTFLLCIHLCVLFLLSRVLCYHELILCSARAGGTYSYIQFPHNRALSRMSTQVRIIVGCQGVCVCDGVCVVQASNNICSTSWLAHVCWSVLYILICFYIFPF